MKYSFIKIFIILFIFLFYKNNIVFADIAKNQVFIIKNILVDTTSSSSSLAKEIALKDAQEEAFASLMRKILLKGEYDKVVTIMKDKNVVSFVEEIEVDNEKTTAERYIGSISVKFKEKEILSFLKKNKIKFSITRSKPLLILPVYSYGGATYLWDDKNIWGELWADNKSNAGLIPIKSSDGKFKDFIYVNPNQILKKNMENLKNIADLYDSKGVLIAFLKKKYSRDKSKTFLDLNLTIHRFDGGEPNNFKDLIEIETDLYSDSFLLTAKSKVQDFVDNQWKVENILSNNMNSIKLTINFNNLKEWTNIKNILGSISIVNKLSIDRFSKDIAVISVLYSGSYNQLKIAFNQSDLNFDMNNKTLRLIK